MTLLINGCSFAEIWKPSTEFIEKLNCDTAVNLGKQGTSFDRTIRTTIEYISNNPKPKFVLIPITLSTRWELSIAKKDVELDGTWFPMQNPEYIDYDSIDQSLSHDKIKSLIENYYGIIPNIRTYWDRMFTNLIGLTSFLELNKIKYLCFDMCNNFQKKHIHDYKGFDKLKIIESNKNIIDLFNFCGNRHMFDNLPESKQRDLDPFMHHHDNEQYLALEKYLIDYLNHRL